LGGGDDLLPDAFVTTLDGADDVAPDVTAFAGAADLVVTGDGTLA